MTVEEFSNEFDTLLGSYRRFKALDPYETYDSIEFNEYEKSLFLTKAQEDLLKELYSGKNYFSESFEKTELLRRELDSLVKTATLVYSTPSVDTSLSDNRYIHKIYTLPNNCWFIVFELIKWGSNISECYKGAVVDVIPVTHDEYIRIRRNPFRGPNKRKVLRLDNGNKLVELISIGNTYDYTIRYIEKPLPIILASLPNGLTIDNSSTVLTCLLPDSIHRDILERAVKLSLQSLSIVNSNKDNKGKN